MLQHPEHIHFTPLCSAAFIKLLNPVDQSFAGGFVQNGLHGSCFSEYSHSVQQWKTGQRQVKGWLRHQRNSIPWHLLQNAADSWVGPKPPGFPYLAKPAVDGKGRLTKSSVAKLKNILLVIGMLLLVFAGYTIIITRNAVHMTTKQKILKAVYPAMMWVTKLAGANSKSVSNNAAPKVPFYSLPATGINGKPLDLSAYKGKKILLVNTASACGYTAQYEQLQQLYTQHMNTLVIIGFPANDFKEQEKGSNEDIASFCQKNFGVTFPLAQKSVVVKAGGQNPVFEWLTNPAKNGWNSQAPDWNFSKYLVNENGVLTNYFGPSVEPMSKQVLDAVQ
jgi:glutathione peroxidase